MEILVSILIFLAGLILLVCSADWLIQSSVKLSLLFKLTPLFIGLILVAFGTSLPEAAIGIIAALKDHKEIALGNVVGSNISNIGLILGLCALIFPFRINRSLFKLEMPVMMFSLLMLYIVSLDLVIGRLEGVLFLICLVLFSFFSYRHAKKVFDEDEIGHFEFKKAMKKIRNPFLIFVITVLSLIGIAAGADLMVRGGVKIAILLGITPWVIGITIFAVGTSLPELVASLTASFKKVPSISVGNIVGSNIFNIFFVLGIVAVIRPLTIAPSVLWFEYPALFLFSILLFTVMRTKYKITRLEGFLMFLGYLTFILFVLTK